MLDMDLEKEVKQLKQENIELREALKGAERRIEELLAQLSQNSRNSNWPSSRDKSRKKRRTKSQRAKSDKKVGGQKGHQGHTLELSEEPDRVEIHRPEVCQHCQEPFTENQPPEAVEKRQVYDLPPLRMEIEEHQAESLSCPHCGQSSQGEFPGGVSQRTQYGPGLGQLAVYLKAEQFIPYGRSRQMLADLFGLHLSPGTLQNMVAKAAKRLEPVVEGIKEALIISEVVHFDESGFYIGGKRHWLHSASTDTLTYYFPHSRRGRQATEAMGILPNFEGTAVHDNWPTYWHYRQSQHSLCNSHHLRELTAVVENDNQMWAERLKWLLLSAKQTVEQARLAGLSALPPAKVAQVERLYTKLMAAALLANPPPAQGWPRGKRGRVKKTKARNLAERLDKRRQQTLGFVYDFKVPFDNNLAERDIRMLKVQQKISGCFRAQAGAEAFCSIRAYISTIRKQGLSVWSALGSVFADDVLLPDLTPV